jgi:hypothetical protein
LGLEASVTNLFGGQEGASTAVGTVLGKNLSRFGSSTDEKTVSNEPLAHGDLFSRNQGRTDSGLDVSQVKYGIAATTLPYVVLMVIGSGQQLRLVLAYSRIPLVTNG